MSKPVPAEPVRSATARRWRRGVIFGALVLLLFLLSVAGWLLASPHIEAWQSWQRAREALAADDLPAAAEHLKSCLTTWSENADAHFQLARASRRLNDLGAAREHLREAARCGHAKDELDLERVLFLAQAGDLDTTEETLHTLLQGHHVAAPLIFEALIKGYLAVHDVKQAVALADLWVRQQPGAWRPYHLRARASELAVQFAPAIEDYQSVVELCPQHPEARFKVGDLLRRLNQFDEALPHLEEAHERDRQNAPVVASLVRCLRSLGRLEEAGALLQAWLAEHPEGPSALLALMGRLELDRQQPDEALRWLREAERLAPRDEEALTVLSSVLRELDRPDEAEKYAARARDVHRKLLRVDLMLQELRAHPGNLDLRCEVGGTLLGLGHVQEGLPWLFRVLEADPAHRPAHQALAEYYESTGKLELARNHRLVAEGKATARLER